MPKGLYKHPSQCGFQKGHKCFGGFTTRFQKGNKHRNWKHGLSGTKEYENKYKKLSYEKWLKKHQNRRNEISKNYEKRKRKDPKHKIDSNISRIIRKSLKGKKASYKWEKLTGYTLQDLTVHLEKQFDDKMTWENYGSYWEIDHKKPKSLFQYEFPEDLEFKKCWALNNLQPMEIKENRKKYNHFEPHLDLGA